MTAKELGNQAADRMTLRQHYAGLAMNGLLSNSYLSKIHETFDDIGYTQFATRACIEIADALLIELAKTDA